MESNESLQDTDSLNWDPNLEHHSFQTHKYLTSQFIHETTSKVISLIKIKSPMIETVLETEPNFNRTTIFQSEDSWVFQNFNN